MEPDGCQSSTKGVMVKDRVHYDPSQRTDISIKPLGPAPNYPQLLFVIFSNL
jgi:hypothetical protein